MPKKVDYNVSEKTETVVQEFIEGLVALGRSNVTLRYYRRTILRFFDNIGKEIDEINKDDIKNWLVQNYEHKNPNTMSRMFVILHVFFKHCSDMCLINKITFNKIWLTRPVWKAPRSLSNQDYIKVMITINKLESLREKAFAMLIFLTGIRVSECNKANVEDIDWKTGNMLVHGKGNKEGYVVIPPECLFVIKQYLASTGNRTSGPLFISYRRPYRRLDTSTIETYFREIGQKAGLKVSLTPHVARHTFAVQCVVKGEEFSEIKRKMRHVYDRDTYTYLTYPDSRFLLEYHKIAG